MNQKKLEDRISTLRDERTRNGWNEKDAIEHEYLIERLRIDFPKSKYL